VTPVAEAQRVELPTPSGVRLAVYASGPASGRAVIGLHGLGGAHDSLLGGSVLQRQGLRVVAYDARGHGRSGAPADAGGYAYDTLVEDLRSVVEWAGPGADGERPLLVGVSMGGLTALRLVLEAPELAAGLVLVTPAFDPQRHPPVEHLPRAAQVTRALRDADLEAFIAAQPVLVEDPAVAAMLRGFAQRQFDRHRDLSTVADAIDALMLERPFDGYDQLAAVRVPVLVIGSHDELDRNHPLRLARAYAAALPGARFLCEPRGSVPFAWRARQISRLTLAFAREQSML
jgi:3-oxoadipate enol-lactonase